MEEQTETERARLLDEADPLRCLRGDFVIPSRADLKRKTLEKSVIEADASLSSTYLCGNSLGLQPRLTSSYLSHYLSTWATKGVYGHFKPISDSPLPPFVQADDAVTKGMAPLVGAQVEEVAVMQTLTVNLHLLLATFYRPTNERHKIILESKAFPSDHYAIESHIKHHNLDPAQSMICIEPPPGTSTMPTSHILSTIRQHASTTALVLLPGIQFYTGQFFDMQTITSEVHALGIPIGWDLAHAVGNVPLDLHGWNVDFACWCMYKYVNCGPGCSGGLFVHANHSSVSPPSSTSAPTSAAAQPAGSTAEFRMPMSEQERSQGYLNRLSGWWGSSKTSRFRMENQFEPIPGAAGWQVSNPSVLDMTSVQASLEVFAKTNMQELRTKSVKMTGWLEELLENSSAYTSEISGLENEGKLFTIITPKDPDQRGAQLSVLLGEGLLEPVMEVLEEEGCVVDERRPNVIRVAPAPLYNTFEDVRRFVEIFGVALQKAVRVTNSVKEGDGTGKSTMVHGGEDSKGWSEIK